MGRFYLQPWLACALGLLPVSCKEVADPPTDPASGPGRIAGRILNASQGALVVVPGAGVNTSFGRTTVANADGDFAIEEAPIGAALVTVSAPQGMDGAVFSSTQLRMSVSSGKTSYLVPRLLTGCALTRTLDAGTGISVKLADACLRPAAYTSLSIPPAGLVRADGSAFAGPVRVEMVPIPFPTLKDGSKDLSWFAGLPGDKRGLRWGGQEGALASLGAVELRLLAADSRAPLHLAPGSHARIQIELHRQPAAGEMPALLSYDPERGAWIEESAGSILRVEGRIVYEAEVAHLSWWRVAVASPVTSCVTGFVTLAALAEANAFVSATGLTYGGASVGTTANDGRFCLPVVGDSRIQLRVWSGASSGGSDLIHVSLAHEDLPIVSSQGTCPLDAEGADLGGSACQDLGEIQLSSPLGTCVMGTLSARRPDGMVVPLADQDIDVYGLEMLSLEQQQAGRFPYSYLERLHTVKLPAGDFCTKLPLTYSQIKLITRYVDGSGTGYTALADHRVTSGMGMCAQLDHIACSPQGSIVLDIN